MEENTLLKFTGGCHCGAVEFEVLAPKSPVIIQCNCSICDIKQNHHFIVPKSHFNLVKGAEKLTTYSFNTHQAKHTFCSICGVQSFYTPRSNQDGYGVMPHCIFGDIMNKTKIKKFDGQNWETEIVKKSEIKEFSKR